MKRTVAFWAAVSVFILAAWTADVRAQYQKPPSPPPSEPRETPPDTLGAGADKVTPAARQQAPGEKPQAAPADTMTAADRIRSAQKAQMTFAFSLGVGTSLNQDPPAFTTEYDPSFDLYLAFGVRRWELEASLSFDYNFFLTTLQAPDDLNVMTLFLNLKYLPIKTTARPYVLACGGWFRSWIVDDLDPTNPPVTVEYEVQGGDNTYEENVLGYGFGGGVEIEMDKVRRIFFDVRYVQGQTRQTQHHANMVIVPIRLGLTWEF